MISQFLDRGYVLAETKAQRDWLENLKNAAEAKDKDALAALRREKVTLAQVTTVIAALNDALAKAKTDESHPQGSAYIPPDPITCGLQQGLTSIALQHELVQGNEPPPPPEVRTRRGGSKSRGAAPAAEDTSPPLRLREVKKRAVPTRAKRGMIKKFVEGNDPLYALDGFKSKFGALFSKPRPFNRNPARIASSAKPLTLFVFGDWGTGLPLAAEVTQQIGKQLAAMDASRQPHVIHLGDVYYSGEPEEYKARLKPYWPVPSAKRNAIGSWSLNGNHDMYSGGHGYFDTLLRDEVMIRWHGDKDGNPSSFFLIEEADWQVFGLDTSWNLPSIGSTIFGPATTGDYGGQNGRLTEEQVKWMASQRKPAKGCILLTHHQPASSRSGDKQHANEAVAMMKKAGVYAGIDAWIWGHEHRCVVFKPKAKRTTTPLKDAPHFCACLGTGGVPVTKENFALDGRIADVLWEENRFDASAPMYEGTRVLPFGFGRIETKPGAFEFRVFDHTGKECYQCTVNRQVAPSGTRGALKPKVKAAAKKVAKKSVKLRKPK